MCFPIIRSPAITGKKTITCAILLITALKSKDTGVMEYQQETTLEKLAIH